jgi:hypothetical protein
VVGAVVLAVSLGGLAAVVSDDADAVGYAAGAGIAFGFFFGMLVGALVFFLRYSLGR